MDEAAAENVNQMTNEFVMASTADAWLILLLGMVRTRGVFTVEQLVQDMPILFLLCRIRKITVVRDVKHSLCLFVCPPSSRKGNR